MIKYCEYILRLGYDVNNNLVLNRRIMLTNKIALILVFAFFVSGILDYINGLYFTSIICFVTVLLNVLVFVLNYKKYYELPFYVILILLNLSIFITDNYVGPEGQNYIFYFPLILCTGLVLNYSKNIWALIALVLPLLLSLISFLGNHSLFINNTLTKDQLTYFKDSNYLICAIASFVIIFLVRRINLEYELNILEEYKALRQIFDRNVDAVFILDLETDRIIDCNYSAVQLFKFNNKESLLGSSTYLFENTNLPKDKNAFVEHVKNTKSTIKNIEYMNAKGEIFWCNMVVIFFESEDKEFLMVRLSENTENKN